MQRTVLNRLFARDSRALFVHAFFAIACAVIKGVLVSGWVLAHWPAFHLSEKNAEGLFWLVVIVWAMVSPLLAKRGRVAQVYKAQVWTTFEKRAVIFLCAAILLRLVLRLRDDMSFDEYDQLAKALQGEWFRNPVRNHYLAQIASGLTLLFASPWGVAVRLPPLLLSALFFFALYRFSVGIVPAFAVGLGLLNLLVNENALWFLGSLRGYSWGLLFSLVTFGLVLEGIRRFPKTGRTLRLWVFGLTFVLSFGAHFCVVTFNLCLVGALVLWLVKAETAGKQKEYLKQLATIGLVFVPICLVAAWFQFAALVEIGRLREVGIWKLTLASESFLVGLGSRHRLVACVSAIVMGSSLLLRGGPRALKRDFLSVFLVFSALLLSVLVATVQSDEFHVRFVSPFLWPFLLWLGESIALAPRKLSRGVLTTAALLLLVVVPALNAKLVRDSYIAFGRELRLSVKVVKSVLPPESNHCVLCVGHAEVCGIFDRLHFPTSRDRHWAEGCSERYVATFRGLPQFEPERMQEYWEDWFEVKDLQLTFMRGRPEAFQRALASRKNARGRQAATLETNREKSSSTIPFQKPKP